MTVTHEQNSNNNLFNRVTVHHESYLNPQHLHKRQRSKLEGVANVVVSMLPLSLKVVGPGPIHSITVTLLNRALLVGNWRQRLGNLKPMFHFHTSWKHQKTSGFLCSDGVQKWIIDLKLVNANKRFIFKCCTSILDIMYRSWAFHSAEFYLIRARNKK